MAVAELLRRITADPEIFGGKPIIRGMRISVELILSLLTQGETVEDILADYPDLEPDDIRACLAYAHAVIAHDSLDAVRMPDREVPSSTGARGVASRTGCDPTDMTWSRLGSVVAIPAIERFCNERLRRRACW